MDGEIRRIRNQAETDYQSNHFFCFFGGESREPMQHMLYWHLFVSLACKMMISFILVGWLFVV